MKTFKKIITYLFIIGNICSSTVIFMKYLKFLKELDIQNRLRNKTLHYVYFDNEGNIIEGETT